MLYQLVEILQLGNEICKINKKALYWEIMKLLNYQYVIQIVSK